MSRVSVGTGVASFTRGFHSSPRVGRERIVVLGSGWGGYEAAMRLDTKKNDVTLVSPANHKVFTPMLPSSATGYIDFQSISEPVRNIPGLHYHQAPFLAPLQR